MLMKSEHRKELVSEIRSLAQSQGLNTVFTTFLEITANSLAAQTDPENAEKRSPSSIAIMMVAAPSGIMITAIASMATQIIRESILKSDHSFIGFCI